MNREYVQIEFWKGDKYPCMEDMEYFEFHTLAEATKKADQIAFENGAGCVGVFLDPDENGDVDFSIDFKNGKSMRIVSMIELGETL